MNPTVAAFLRSWTFAPWTILLSLLTLVVYLRGWRALVRRRAARWTRRELAMFSAGLAAFVLAVVSPLDTFSGLLLSVHMVQHLVLLFVAPPLLLLAQPQLPLLHGLPREIVAYWVVPLLRTRAVRAAIHALTHPAATWLAAAIILLAWHLPALYERALDSEFWHVAEHACFLASGILFWWPIVQPWPSRAVWPRAAMLAYLFLAMLPSTVLCAFFAFADQVIYPRYAAVPRVGGISALTDQAIAGALMWVLGTIAYLVPLTYIARELLYPERLQRNSAAAPRRYPESGAARSPRSARAGLDLLQMPLVGAALRWPYTRRILQLLMFILAMVVIFDGLTGPPFAPLNLAGVLPWTHWRGLVVLMLLFAGNLACMVCPLTLLRAATRPCLAPRWHWPRWLCTKWLAVALLALYFWAYEAFDLWLSPWLTAWIAQGYFLVAFIVDTLFHEAAFCKYVCPVGQFQFVQSLVSPWTVRVRDTQVCTTCRTKECVRGSATARGCEMQLFVPRKSDNLDCTFCLDCVHGCPSANIGVLTVWPASSPRRDTHRMWRADVAALVLFLIFAAFANAAGMIAPVVAVQQWCERSWGLSTFAVESLFLGIMLVAVPGAAVIVAAAVSRCASRSGEALSEIIARYAVALVPIGAAMWLAHYGFHLVVGAWSFLPASVRLAQDWGWRMAELPSVARRCCAIEPPAWLLKAEILSLDLGLLLSLYLVWRVSGAARSQSAPRRGAWLPWSALVLLLFAWGIWIVQQPMEMRGTMTAELPARGARR